VQSSVQDAVYICTIDAGGDGSIADLAKLYRELGKRVFAICDKQTDAKKALIETQVEKLYMHEEHGFEDMVMKNTTEAAMTRFAATFAWPPHLVTKYPNPAANVKAALSEYFAGKKAEWGLADFLAQCAEDEIPQWLCESCISIRELCEPSPAVPVPPSPPAPPQSTVPPA
jgi:putative ATP-dependent endonuclease of OLD family